MSSPSWQKSLHRALDALATSDRPPRVAIVGMGQEFNGDDAAGLIAARELLSRGAELDRLLVIDAGPAPENQTGALRRFGPDLVLLIDAAQMSQPPGTVGWIPWQQTTGISATTHTLPPYMLAQFLTADLGCEVALLGIQPAANQIDTPLSPVVKAACRDVVDALGTILAL